MDLAITRCARLAYHQKLLQQTYQQWRQLYIEEPLAHLKQQARIPQSPEQQAHVPRLLAAQEKVAAPDISTAVAIYRRGFEAMTSLGPKETKTLDALRLWTGREAELVEQVHRESRGEPSSLKPDEYAAAVQIGRVGNVLQNEAAGRPRPVPQHLADHKSDLDRLAARLSAFRMPTPFHPTEPRRSFRRAGRASSCYRSQDRAP